MTGRTAVLGHSQAETAVLWPRHGCSKVAFPLTPTVALSFRRLYPLRGYYRNPFTSFSPGFFRVTSDANTISINYRLGLQPIIPLVAIAVILVLALHNLEGVPYARPVSYALIIFIGPLCYNVWRVRRLLRTLINHP